MPLSAPLLLAIIGFSSLIAQWIAWLLRLPAILPLLVFGIILGPITHVLQPDALFGDLLFPLVSLSVAIILFEGALTLRIDEIRGLGGVVRNLIVIGMPITFIIISLACWLLLNFPPELAALVGAVTVVTGPTVIAPLMRVVRPNAAINQVLRWEGIVIDPVGAIFTLLVFEFIVLRQHAESLSHLFWTPGVTAATGLSIGANAVARALALALQRLDIPVMLTDSSWEYYRQARMDGIPAYYGNAWSEHAENYLDLSDIAQVLALSPNRHQNTLGVYHFSHIFGAGQVASIRSGSTLAGRRDTESPRFRRHETLFGAEQTYSHLSALLAKGAVINATQLTENCGWLDYLEKHPGVIPLFALKESGKPEILGNSAAPEAPCTPIALVQNENSSNTSR